MKKTIAVLLALICVFPAVLAGNVFVERVNARGGDIQYIADDTAIETTGRFPIFKARVRDFYATRKEMHTITNAGSLVIQGKDIDGNRLRLSVSFDKEAEILENTENRLYVETSGRIIYYKRGEGIAITKTDSIRYDYNKIDGLVNIAGGEDTDYKFRVHNMEII